LINAAKSSLPFA